MSDSFRKLNELTTPDPRSEMWLVADPDTGEARTIEIKDIHSQLEKLELHEGVPEKVRTHFNTTRNIFLYSWYVWRFRAVAEWHAFATLELALKIRSQREGKRNNLSHLIGEAMKKGWVKNEGFSIWQSAKQGYKEQKMIMKLVCPQPESEICDVDDDQFSYNYIKILRKGLPCMRNEYAHGSNMLGPGTYSHLLIVSEFINQLFKKDNV